MNEDELYIFNLPEDKLIYVPHEIYKWQCCHLGCNKGTKVKDYGISPFYRWRKKWVDLSNNVFCCHLHFQLYKKAPFNFKYKLGEGTEHLTKV